MKTLFIILIAIPLCCRAQSDYDSLKQKILKIDVAVNNMHNNMLKAHDQFRTGTILVATGIMISVIGTVIITSNAKESDTYDHGQPVVTGPVMLYLGSGLVAVGGIMQIDSHKWFGYGGRKSKQKKSLLHDRGIQ